MSCRLCDHNTKHSIEVPTCIFNHREYQKLPIKSDNWINGTIGGKRLAVALVCIPFRFSSTISLLHPTFAFRTMIFTSFQLLLPINGQACVHCTLLNGFVRFINSVDGCHREIFTATRNFLAGPSTDQPTDWTGPTSRINTIKFNYTPALECHPIVNKNVVKILQVARGREMKKNS